MVRGARLSRARRYRCSECCKSDYGNYFISETLCKKCAAKRRRKNPTYSVQLSENLSVTNNVEKRLRRDAEAEYPETLACRISEIGAGLTLLLSIVLGIWYGTSDAPKPESGGLKWLIALAWVMLTYLAFVLVGVILSGPKHKRERQVEWRTLELARTRAGEINERESFYSSPEWKLLRDKVIREEGKLCSDCRTMIKRDVDVTVDHVLPRSKYPDLALKRDNLRVLCRSCNSSKGNAG